MKASYTILYRLVHDTMFMHPTTCVQRHTLLNPLAYGIPSIPCRVHTLRGIFVCAKLELYDQPSKSVLAKETIPC